MTNYGNISKHIKNNVNIENYRVCDMILNGLLWCSKDCEVEHMSEKIEEWINADQAAEFFGVKPATIREWIRKGKGIPATKIGKQWKFKYSELDAWAKSGAAADDSSDNK